MPHWIMRKISDKIHSIMHQNMKFKSEKFFYEKGNYLRNGIALTEALLLTEDDVDKRLRENILNGMRLSEAMRSLELFSNREISLIKLAEETGDLAGAFQSIYISLKEQRELSGKIMTVLIYPMVLLGTAYVFLISAIYYIVPPLYEMLKELGTENEFLKFISYIHLNVPISVLLVLTAALILFLIKTSKSKDKIFRLVLGTKTAQYEEMIFIEELTLLSKGGLDLIEIFQILRGEGYPCENLLSSIEDGVGLKDAFQQEGYSPGLVSYLTMAEETGNYTDAFQSYVNLQKVYFKDYLKKKTALIEPAAIILMGFLVFMVAYIIMIPMLDAYENL
ncbi:MAG TPA: type II secretion system F family protein [Proteiniclasticum sp.]|nr:type II secretion system F family protein [Proteiniclasticum sp.]